jgi:hypothetical protein
MAARTSKSILTAVLLWIVILSGIAAALRYFVLPEFREKKMAKLAGQTGSEGRYKSIVRVAADGFSGYCILRSPEFADRLARAGIRVEIQDDGADYPARMRALRDGDVQMAVFPVNGRISLLLVFFDAARDRSYTSRRDECVTLFESASGDGAKPFFEGRINLGSILFFDFIFPHQSLSCGKSRSHRPLRCRVASASRASSPS